MIGAGAIVAKDIPNNSVAAGIPAKVIENICEYAEKKRNKTDQIKNINDHEKRQFLEGKYYSQLET